MSGPDAASAGQYRVPAGLLEKLVAAVRPEFRAGELAFDPRDPVLGGKPCLVPACERPVAGHGLCQGHRQRWTAEGRPDVQEFATSTDPRWRRNAPLDCCQAPGCGYGVGHRKGLCSRHASAWDRAGAPSLPEWLGTLADPKPASPPGDCLTGSCGLWAEPGSDWCRSHTATWKQHGRPPAAEFAARWAGGDPGAARERIRLDGLPAQMKLEMQYALQRRHDDREGKAPPYVVMIMIRFLAGSGASSLLERTEQEWRDAFGKRGNVIALLAWSRLQVADLAEGSGWDAEYPRDAWQMHRLGFEGRVVLNFSRIPQQELKDLAKRWIRWRLSTGLGLDAGGTRPLRVLTRLAAFLHGRGITERRRDQPGRARGLPRRPPRRHGRQGGTRRSRQHHRPVPDRGPPARLGPGPAAGRDDLPRRPASPHRAAAPVLGGTQDSDVAGV